MARIHAAAFADQRPWSAAEFTTLLDSPHIFAVTNPAGFALGRVVLDEVELLTIATLPKGRRKGIARGLLAEFEAAALRRGATCAYLEVAADNTPARALYGAAGYVETGRRDAYYQRESAPAVDAVMMAKTLT
nr:GNAT family N-acetyltransferase [Aliiroseovarius subalbicans]